MFTNILSYIKVLPEFCKKYLQGLQFESLTKLQLMKLMILEFIANLLD